MLNLKKVIALVCTLALVITSVSVVSFAEAYTDVTESSAYYEAVESLSKLGIVTGYEDGTYKPEETVTRAEMAALIARIQGYEETAKANANTVFTDVPSTYWASGYVAQANGQGIINGYGDGTFGPDDAVKYEEAVKMIMATLGYTPYAMNNGGYPTGYLAAAQFYGVTKSVSNAVTGTGANRGTIAQLLANAIDTPIMGQSKWSTDGSVEYTIYDGKDNNSYKTLMSENLDVVKLKGVITESSVASIKGDKNINNDEAAKIKVDITGNYDTNNKDFQPDSDGKFTGAENTFLVAESDAEDYLGMAVILYVRENDDNEYEVISIAADGTKNDIVTFTLDQFDVVEESTSGSTTTTTTTTYIKYFKNSTDSSSIKKQLASNYAITLNGASKNIDDIFGAGMVVEPNGKSMKGGLVTLIDNDGKTGYDVVMVEVAATAVVDEIGDETISFKEQAQLPTGPMSSLDVEEDATDTVIDIVKDGKAIAYTDLKEWDVLSIVAPDDTNNVYIKVDVISNPITGQITSDKTSKTSDTGKAYKIDGKFYDVAEGSYKTNGLSVNDAGIFYIDKYGKIAAFSEDSSVATGVAGTYGYVFNTLVTDKNMDKEVQVKLITANGAELLTFASSVNVSLANGNKATFKTSDITDENVKNDDATQNGFTVTDLKGQVVKYTKNSSGALKTIVFANYNDSFESVSYTSATETYDADNYRLGKYIDKDSKVFFVNKSDADKCSLGTPEDLSDNNTYKVLAFYADSKAEENNIVVIEGNTNTSSKATSLAVITEAATAKDENDNDIMTLSYIVDGTVVKDVNTIDDVDIVSGEGKALNVTLNAGDIVRIKTNSAGKISGITVLWDMAEDVRADYNTTYATQKTTGDPAGTRDGETLYGGAVTAAKDSDKVYLGKLDWNKKDSEGKVIALADQVTEWVNLGKAKNVYTVQTIREGNVSVKKGGSFNYVKQMFDNTGSYNFVYNGTETKDAVNEANLAKYVDHLFVREYDGRIEDVVIVKAPKKVSAR